jgi:LPXTG-site transpeptidase (sortase) family protein
VKQFKFPIVGILVFIICLIHGDAYANSTPMLVIPRLMIDQPIGEIALVNHIWDTADLGNGVAHLGTTGWIENFTNTVLAGHYNLSNGQPGAFYRLSRISIGDWLWIVVGERVFTYQITAIFTVDPNEVSVTYPVPGETAISLITCSGDLVNGFYDKRLIVRGVLVQQ